MKTNKIQNKVNGNYSKPSSFLSVNPLLITTKGRQKDGKRMSDKQDYVGKCVPSLRFPEFRNSEQWYAYQLSDISTPVIKKVGKIALTPVSITAGIGFVSQMEKFGQDISGSQYRNYIILCKGDFAYNKGNSLKFPQGCIYRLKEFDKVAAPNAFICFRIKQKYVADFYTGYFEKNYHGLQLRKYITSGARSNGLLNINDASFFSITLPTPLDRDEQKKIAQCLASINTQIRQQQKQIDVLKQHKKALLQQLFPQRGQSTPLLRYFIGSKKKWDYVEMRKVAILRTKRNVNNSKKVMTNSANYGIIMQQDYFERNIVDNDHLQKYYIVENGDFVYNSRISVTAPVGPISKNYLATGVISPLYMVFRFNIDKDDFYVYYFQSEHWQVQLKRIANNGARFDRMSISPSDFFNIKIPVPSAEEREYISKLFISIDNLINNMQQKVDLLMLQKKGLLQKLFPN